VSWRLVPLQRSLGDWSQSWDSLNAAIFDSNPLFDSRFVEPLLRYFGTGNEILCCHEEQGRLNGLVILSPRRFGVWRIFAPSQAPIVPVYIESVSNLDSLFRRLPGWAWSLELLNQDSTSSVLPRGTQLARTVFLDHARTIRTDLDGDFTTFWEHRNKKLQNNIKRYLRRVEEAGIALSLQHHKEPAAVQAAVGRYSEMESAGWKGTAGTALREGDVQEAFYRDVLAQFSQFGNASVYELYFDDKPVASRLAIRNAQMVVMLKTTYDESFANYAAGRLLLHAVLQHEFALRRSRSVEFYTNANPDQLQWSTSSRMIRHATLFRSQFAKTVHRWMTRTPSNTTHAVVSAASAEFGMESNA
jgi:Acetyltransferase (GNAT) domain